jgi:hypothetical protein
VAAGQAGAAGVKGHSVAEALREGNYPWYDRDTDSLRPIWPPRRPWLKWLRDRVEKSFQTVERWLRRVHLGNIPGLGSAGESIGTLLLMTVLAAFFVALLVVWARQERGVAHRAAARSRLGTVARLAGLPEGIQPEKSDPWEEARRLHAAGDYAGAIVFLFAHQLIRLDELGLIRLGPGRTGRQYVRGLRDPELATVVRPTLTMFEDVYYGGRVPRAAAFEAVWSRAQVFDELCGLRGASR